MNKDILEGKWDELKGEVRKKWGKLTDDDMEQVKGQADKLSAIVQQKYGEAKDKVEEQIDELMQKFK